MTEHDLQAPNGGDTPTARAVGLEGALVRAEILGRVGVITLDDERRRKALSAQMVNRAVTALEGLRAGGVRAVVLAPWRECTSGVPGKTSTNSPAAGAIRWATTILSNYSSVLPPAFSLTVAAT